MGFLSGIGKFFKTIGTAIKGGFTGNPLGFIGQAVSLGMGLYKGITAGKQRRQKELMDYQDQINDANYEREREDKLADYHMGLNDQKQLIKEERQYNSIGAQMNRARNAGVSPLAALGVSSGNTLASVSPPAPTSSSGVSPTSDSVPQYLSNAITLITTLQDMKLRKERLNIEKDLAKQEIRESETRSILNEMQAEHFDEETVARINKLLAEGRTEDARTELTKAQTTTEGAKQAELLSVVALNDAKTITEDYLRESELHINQWQARALQSDISRSFSQIRVDNATIDSLVDSLATNEVSRKKMSQEISNLVVLRDKTIAEIKRIESDTSLDKTRKQQMIAGIVRDYAFSATSIVNAIFNFMPTKSMNKGQSMAWNELVDIAGVSAVLD